MIEPGDTLYGFCAGHFGRDWWGDKVVVALGRDWVVARENGHPVFAAVDPADLVQYLRPEEADS